MRQEPNPGFSSFLHSFRQLESERCQPNEPPRDYPLLRTLLSNPPLCSQEKQKELMHIASTVMTGLLTNEIKTGETSSRGKSNSRRGSTNNARKRQGTGKRKIGSEADGINGEQICCSPDTTVRSPIKLAPPGAVLYKPTTLNIGFQNPLFTSTACFSEPEKSYLSTGMGISDQMAVQWSSDQFNMASNNPMVVSHQLPFFVETPVAVQPTVMCHKKYGLVEYYPMQPQQFTTADHFLHDYNIYNKKPKYETQDFYNNHSNQYEIQTQYGNYGQLYRPTFPVHQWPIYNLQNRTEVLHGPVGEVQYEGLEQPHYQTISPPCEEPPQQAPVAVQDKNITDSFFWEDFESSIQSDSSCQQKPIYEDVSPVSDAPDYEQTDTGFYSTGSWSASSSNDETDSGNINGDTFSIGTGSPHTDNSTDIENPVKEFLKLL